MQNTNRVRKNELFYTRSLPSCYHRSRQIDGNFIVNCKKSIGNWVKWVMAVIVVILLTKLTRFVFRVHCGRSTSVVRTVLYVWAFSLKDSARLYCGLNRRCCLSTPLLVAWRGGAVDFWFVFVLCLFWASPSDTRCNKLV